MRSFRLLPLFSGILLAFSFGAQAGNGFSPEINKLYSQGEQSHYLAGAHANLGLDCTGCHESAVVSDSETEINAQCQGCHDPVALAEKTAVAGQPNPHKSHLGEVQCTACHSGHNESVAYCSNCHDFPSLKNMKFGKNAKPVNQREDLNAYDDAKPLHVETTDILIVGSGAAGYAAAITAQEAGVKNIVMIEKMAVPGGNSRLAAGGMNAAGTKYQAVAGIEDNAELMRKDTMKGGKNVSNPELVKILAEKSNESIEWLAERGAVLSHVGRGGGASAARMHGPAGGEFVGPYLANFFKTQSAKNDMELRLNSKLVKLVTDEKGGVTGALIKGKHSGIYQVNAKSIVLATGGIGANTALIQNLRPDISPDVKTSNQPGSQGDGMVLAQKIGADVVDAKEIQLNPTLLVGSPVIISEKVRGAGAVFVNREGKRFISELTTRDVTSAAVAAQTGGTAFEIFDEKVRQSVKQTGAAFALGLAKEGKTIGELAKNAGIDPIELEKTIKQYNTYAAASKDPDFDRPGINPKLQVNTPNYYAIEITPAIHYYMGGLKFNEKAQVVNKEGQAIKGLYAAGEVTGGLHGKNRLGGNSISETITFGRIAGQSAAENAKTK